MERDVALKLYEDARFSFSDIALATAMAVSKKKALPETLMPVSKAIMEELAEMAMMRKRAEEVTLK